MVLVRWGKGHGRRIVGSYVWERVNGWTQEVGVGDLLEILTNQGFSVAESDDLERILGVGPGTAEDLLLAGVATVAHLLEADADALASRLEHIGPATVEGWQEMACRPTSTQEEVRA